MGCLKTLTDQCGKKNPSGIKTLMYLADASDITNKPKLKSEMTPAGTAPGDGVTIGEAFTTAVGAGFYPYKIIPMSGKVDDNAVGEIGGKTWESSFEFKIRGTDAEVLEFAANTVNCCLIGIAIEKSGQRRVLGDIEDHAWIESAVATTGMAATDLRGVTFTLKSVQGNPAPIYDAELTIPEFVAP